MTGEERRFRIHQWIDGVYVHVDDLAQMLAEQAEAWKVQGQRDVGMTFQALANVLPVQARKAIER